MTAETIETDGIAATKNPKDDLPAFLSSALYRSGVFNNSELMEHATWIHESAHKIPTLPVVQFTHRLLYHSGTFSHDEIHEYSHYMDDPATLPQDVWRKFCTEFCIRSGVYNTDEIATYCVAIDNGMVDFTMSAPPDGSDDNTKPSSDISSIESTEANK